MFAVLFWAVFSTSWAQDYSCADDISPGSILRRVENNYISCLILNGKNEKSTKRAVYKQLRTEFVRQCAKDEYCKNNIFKSEKVEEKCFEEEGQTLCHLIVRFNFLKNKYDANVNVKKEVISKNILFKDKSAIHIGLTPTTGFIADFTFRKTQLNKFGWQIGLGVMQEYVQVGAVKDFASSEINANAKYPDRSAFTSAAGIIGFVGASYNTSIGGIALVPQVNGGFFKVTVSDDPWFGKDITTIEGGESVKIPHALTEGVTYFAKGALLMYFDDGARDNWFLKLQGGIFGEAYLPVFISLGIGKQFSL